MVFRDALGEDLVVMCDPDEFGEEIFWYPDGDLGDKRTFNAIVDRGQVELVEGHADILTHQVEVTIPYSTVAANGLTAINKGVDLGDVVLQERGAKVRVRCMEIIEQDPGGWTVIVAK